MLHAVRWHKLLHFSVTLCQARGLAGTAWMGEGNFFTLSSCVFCLAKYTGHKWWGRMVQCTTTELMSSCEIRSSHEIFGYFRSTCFPLHSFFHSRAPISWDSFNEIKLLKEREFERMHHRFWSCEVLKHERIALEIFKQSLQQWDRRQSIISNFDHLLARTNSTNSARPLPSACLAPSTTTKQIRIAIYTANGLCKLRILLEFFYNTFLDLSCF